MRLDGFLAPSRLELSGWLNQSDVAHFNVLHDHGTALLSCVYFADDGGDVVRTPNGERATPNDGGHLVLRTQLEAFTHRYGFFSVAPTPGELWVFPGYLSHCVMPRLLSKTDGTSARRRLTVAINVT